jgi:hypothetical protein
MRQTGLLVGMPAGTAGSSGGLLLRPHHPDVPVGIGERARIPPWLLPGGCHDRSTGRVGAFEQLVNTVAGGQHWVQVRLAEAMPETDQGLCDRWATSLNG